MHQALTETLDIQKGDRQMKHVGYIPHVRSFVSLREPSENVKAKYCLGLRFPGSRGVVFEVALSAKAMEPYRVSYKSTGIPLNPFTLNPA